MTRNATQQAIAEMRSSLEVLGGIRFVLKDVVDVRSVTGADLVLGEALGLLDARSGQELELYRARLGYEQDDLQLHLAAAGDLRPPDRVGGDAPPTECDGFRSTFWFVVAMRLLVTRWLSGAGDPVLDSAPIIDAWGDTGARFWSAVRPRGADAFFFGWGARRRFVGRAEAYLDRLSPAPSSGSRPPAAAS